jgi:hypothetical protein
VSLWVPWISREDVFQTSLDAPEDQCSIGFQPVSFRTPGGRSHPE